MNEQQPVASYVVSAVLRELVQTVKKPWQQLEQLRGRRMMILGPPGSGKTSLLMYIERGQLADTDQDFYSDYIETTARFKLLRSNGNWITFKHAKAYPGQLEVDIQVRQLRRERPHLGIIVLDASQYVAPSERQRERRENASSRRLTQDTAKWFNTLADELVFTYGRCSRPVRQGLSLLIVINKIDSISQTALKILHKELMTILQDRIANALGAHAYQFTILPCSLVAGDRYEKTRQDLIEQIGLTLSQ